MKSPNCHVPGRKTFAHWAGGFDQHAKNAGTLVIHETRLSYQAKTLRLELRDDGEGFSATEGHDGMGLTGMRERVEQMGGELEITSSQGKGTKITVLLPCNGESIS